MTNLELLSEIALTLDSKGDIAAQMHAVLGKTGRHLGVSRVYIFQDSDDGTSTSNTYEWCGDGVVSQIDALQNLEYASFPSWKKLLSAEGLIRVEGKTIFILDGERLRER